MATDKTFTVAGVSKHKGEYKVRFANDLVDRMKALHKNGHEDIRLANFETPVTKYEAILSLVDLDEFKDPNAASCILEWLDQNRPKTVKVNGPAVTRTRKVDQTEVDEENEPF